MHLHNSSCCMVCSVVKQSPLQLTNVCCFYVGERAPAAQVQLPAFAASVGAAAAAQPSRCGWWPRVGQCAGHGSTQEPVGVVSGCCPCKSSSQLQVFAPLVTNYKRKQQHLEGRQGSMQASRDARPIPLCSAFAYPIWWQHVGAAAAARPSRCGWWPRVGQCAGHGSSQEPVGVVSGCCPCAMHLYCYMYTCNHSRSNTRWRFEVLGPCVQACIMCCLRLVPLRWAFCRPLHKKVFGHHSCSVVCVTAWEA
jgi:hypothetical protein